MNTLTDFYDKLDNCDVIALTLISSDRLYCRFFKDNLYKSRVFVSDPTLIAELSQLCGKGEIVDTKGVAKLKQAALTV
ncbi:hypothetical protein [Pontibacter harenae]|uniref:hypothetical protein n=1 Tax=Pontibacter harenae TaxID=2894083 RepID=UPI001E2A906F|nr:hypothetical protein [Pontibacter harenae]MCC9166441.1 hypothetical protein [Pontibacter harenae]